MCVLSSGNSTYAAVFLNERENCFTNLSRCVCEVTEDLPHELLCALRVAGHQRHELDLVEEDDALKRVQPGHHALCGNGVKMAAPESLHARSAPTYRNPYGSRGIHSTAQLLPVDVVGSRKPHPLHGCAWHHGEGPRSAPSPEHFDDIVDPAEVDVGFCSPDNQCGVGLVEPVAEPRFGSLLGYRRAVEQQGDSLTEFGLTAAQYLCPLGPHHLRDAGNRALDEVADRPGDSVQEVSELVRVAGERERHVHEVSKGLGLTCPVCRGGRVFETAPDEVARDVNDLVTQAGVDASAGISQILRGPMQKAGLKRPLSRRSQNWICGRSLHPGRLQRLSGQIS